MKLDALVFKFRRTAAFFCRYSVVYIGICFVFVLYCVPLGREADCLEVKFINQINQIESS